MPTSNQKQLHEGLWGVAEKTITLGIFLIFIVSVLALCSRDLGVDLTNADGLWMEDYQGLVGARR